MPLRANNDVRIVKDAFVNTAATGNTALVAAITGKKIRVLSVIVFTTLANTIKFQSATTDISATFPLAANGNIISEVSDGLFETAVGEALNVNLSVATATGVSVTYEVI